MGSQCGSGVIVYFWLSLTEKNVKLVFGICDTKCVVFMKQEIYLSVKLAALSANSALEQCH